MSLKIKEKNDYMSTVVSVKLDAGHTINPVELERFNCAAVGEFFSVRQDKKNSLEYTGPLVSRFGDFIQRPIDSHDIYFIVEQIVNALLQLQVKEFLWTNVYWGIEHVYIVEQTRQLKFIYLPINEGYAGVSAKDLIVNIICSSNVNETDTSFVSDFIQFINSQEFFNPQGIENYIKNKDIDAFDKVKTPQPFTFNSDDLSDGLVPSSDEEETRLLQEGLHEDVADDVWSEETTLLVEEKPVRYPVLLRVATNEVVRVNKDSFRIGKNKHVVDFHVTNNKAVSREHIDVLTHDGQFFVKDLESKNHTFLNDQRIGSFVECEIKPGDHLLLGNEEFVVQDPDFV